jgi:DNA-directed RNA polymerase subunit RPC12/RpoP
MRIHDNVCSPKFNNFEDRKRAICRECVERILYTQREPLACVFKSYKTIDVIVNN